jgi:hypothetical protein
MPITGYFQSILGWTLSTERYATASRILVGAKKNGTCRSVLLR